MEHAPEPRFAIVGMGTVPNWVSLAPKVKNQHLVIRHSRQKCLNLRVMPEIPFVIEHPSLHNPYSLRVHVRHRLVNLSAYPFQIFRVICRRYVFIECIGSVIMVCTINLCLRLEEQLSDFGEHFLGRVQHIGFREIHPLRVLRLHVREFFDQCRGHVACK